MSRNWKTSTARFYVFFAQFSPMMTSYANIVHCPNQRIDIGSGLLTTELMYISSLFTHTCVWRVCLKFYEILPHTQIHVTITLTNVQSCSITTKTPPYALPLLSHLPPNPDSWQQLIFFLYYDNIVTLRTFCKWNHTACNHDA